MDIALKEPCLYQQCFVFQGFNPYSDGYCSESLILPVGIVWQKRVSILILMDIALKENTKRKLHLTDSCFNPYSDGYCSESSDW